MTSFGLAFPCLRRSRSDLPGSPRRESWSRLLRLCRSHGTGQSGRKETKSPRRCAWLLRQLRAGRGRILRTSGSRYQADHTVGKEFWPLAADERSEITRLFEKEHVRQLATMLRSRKDDAPVEMLDAAYWKKGCSSLGKLRYCVLLGVGDKQSELCLMT